MKGWVGVFKAWRRARAINRSRALFLRLYNDPAAGMDKIVDQVAERLARARMMNWLDNKRIIHCRFCPNTEGLRNHHMDKLCEGHFEMVAAKEAAADPKRGG